MVWCYHASAPRNALSSCLLCRVYSLSYGVLLPSRCVFVLEPKDNTNTVVRPCLYVHCSIHLQVHLASYPSVLSYERTMQRALRLCQKGKLREACLQLSALPNPISRNALIKPQPLLQSCDMWRECAGPMNPRHRMYISFESWGTSTHIHLKYRAILERLLFEMSLSS